MEYHVDVTEPALRDLRAIYEFVHADETQNAEDWFVGLREASSAWNVFHYEATCWKMALGSAKSFMAINLMCTRSSIWSISAQRASPSFTSATAPGT